MNRKPLIINLTVFFLLMLLAVMQVYVEICLRSDFFSSPFLAVIVGIFTGYIVWTSLMRAYISFMLKRLAKSERTTSNVDVIRHKRDTGEIAAYIVATNPDNEELLDELDRFENNVQEMGDE